MRQRLDRIEKKVGAIYDILECIDELKKHRDEMTTVLYTEWNANSLSELERCLDKLGQTLGSMEDDTCLSR